MFSPADRNLVNRRLTLVLASYNPAPLKFPPIVVVLFLSNKLKEESIILLVHIDGDDANHVQSELKPLERRIRTGESFIFIITLTTILLGVGDQLN